jgi:hypothetical protein
VLAVKLEIGKCSYPLSVPIGQINSVGVDDPAVPSYSLLLARRTVDELIAMRLKNRTAGKPEKRDIPEYWAISHHGDTLEICPAPDKAYHCTVKYFPPQQEI